jgi:N-acetyl sugar amidotransferase
MFEIIRCVNCLLPSTKPDLHFDDKGICGACRYQKYYDKINWEERKNEFHQIMDAELKKNPNNNYDCTIAVSGGKDSTYQAYLIKEMGYKALLLNFEPSYPTELGKRNLERMRNTYGFDLIELKKSPTYRKLSRIAFDLIGDHEWPNHVGIYCWPIQIANNFNIPLTFYGEPRGLIGLGRFETFVDQGVDEISREIIEQYCGLGGLRLTDIMEYDKTLKYKDLIPYRYPEPEELKQNIKAIDLGHYFKWDFEENVKIIKKDGWESADHFTEGSIVNYEDLDCGFMPIHQYFKFIKYGYGRGTDCASYEIRHNRLTKKDAQELITEHDGSLPKKYFKEFLEYLNIDEEYFYNTVDKYANPYLFKKDNNGRFIRNDNNNLIANDVWHNSFK